MGAKKYFLQIFSYGEKNWFLMGFREQKGTALADMCLAFDCEERVPDVWIAVFVRAEDSVFSR